MKNERISVPEAAQMMGATCDFIRAAMQLNLINIGVALRRPGKTRYTYYIYRDKVINYMEGNEP